MSISKLNGQDRLRAAAALEALRSSAARPTAPSTPGATRQPDAVSLSDSARSLASALKSVGSADDVREDRVAAIKAALANGTYTIDSRQLAADLTSRFSS